jgi:hypothetical protein
MNLITEPYLEQKRRWPASGSHILAQFDDASVVVYQAFSPDIARFAVANGYFGGGFSLTRMSWIKPNFLWMMYRSGWAQKENQERVLAVRLLRKGFDAILAQVVPSSYSVRLYATRAEWGDAMVGSTVRLQWDPDHNPAGAPLPRRAIQLGLKNETLRLYSRDWIVEIEDITDFVVEQRAFAAKTRWDQLLTPREDVYVPASASTRARLGLDVA